MDERRKLKNNATEEGKENYKQLNYELRRERDMAKKKWWKENCEDLKELYEKVRSDFLFNKRKLKDQNRERNCESC